MNAGAVRLRVSGYPQALLRNSDQILGGRECCSGTCKPLQMHDLGVTLAVGTNWLRQWFPHRIPALTAVPFLRGSEGERLFGKGEFSHSCCTLTPVVLIDGCVLSPIPDLSVLSATQPHGAAKWGKWGEHWHLSISGVGGGEAGLGVSAEVQEGRGGEKKE